MHIIPIAILISFVVNFVLAIPFINFLYKISFYKTKSTDGIDTSKRNPLYYSVKGSSMGTPSSFGLLLLLNYLVLIGLFAFYFKETSSDLFIVVGYAILFLFLGLIDDVAKYYLYLKTKFWGLRFGPKLFIQMLFSVGFFAFLLSSSLTYFGNLQYTLTLILSILLLALITVFITNSFNITDGLDGLSGGISLFVLITYLYFELRTYDNFFALILLATLIGFQLAFLYFNIHPARVHFGDTGSMTLGFIIAVFGLRYSFWTVVPLLALILLEGGSSVVQMASIKFLNKRVFLIAPFHLHLLNGGWSETKVVFRAWILQIILVVISIAIFEFLLQG